MLFQRNVYIIDVHRFLDNDDHQHKGRKSDVKYETDNGSFLVGTPYGIDSVYIGYGSSSRQRIWKQRNRQITQQRT